MIKQCRTCNSCRACRYSGGYYICLLGYSIDCVRGRPTEKCPKPKTIGQMSVAPRKKIENMNSFKRLR